MKRKEEDKENVEPLEQISRPKRACREKIFNFIESSDEEESIELDENNNVVKQVRLKSESEESESASFAQSLDESKSHSESENQIDKREVKEDKVEPNKTIQEAVQVQTINVPDGVQVQNDSIKDFRELLLSIKTSKTNASSGIANDLPVDVKLEISKFGKIDLPISTDRAEQLIKFIQPKSRKAAPVSYDTYQILPKKFKIKNENWHDKLTEFANKLCAEMEWRCPVKLELQFLTVSRPYDSNMSRKVFSSNSKNSLGTLILELPSVYTGGSISVEHEKIDSSNKAEPSIQFLAHSSSLSHSISSLSTGNRLILFYSILEDDQDVVVNQMSQCLLQLKNSNQVVGYDLENSYTKSSQSRFHELDNLRSNIIKNANSLLEPNDQFAIYILSIKASRTFTDESGYELLYHRRNFRRISYYRMREEADENCVWKETDRTFVLNFYELNGADTDICARLKSQIDPNFISHIVHSKRNIDLNNFKEHSYLKTYVDGERNEDITKLITYTKQLLVMWPKAKEQEIKLALNPFIGLKLLTGNVDDEYLKILSLTLNSMNASNTQIETVKVNSLFKAIKNSQRLDLFFQFLNFDYGDSAKRVFDSIFKQENKEFLKEFAELIVQHGYLNLKERLNEFFKQNVSFELMCRMVQALLVIDPDVAFNCLEENLVEKVDLAIDLNLFIETIFQFEQEEKFTNVIQEIKSKFNSSCENFDNMARLMIDLSKLISIDKLERYFGDICRSLLEHLKQKLAEFDEFTWCMPHARFPQSKRIESFLRSKIQSIEIKSINFKNLLEAREFANMHGSLRSTYSVIITAQGRGNTAYLSLTKTRAYFDTKRFELRAMRKEQNALADILSKFQS